MTMMQDFAPSDFATDGLSDEQRKAYRTDLLCTYITALSMTVSSQRAGHHSHIVTHNGVFPTGCDCEWFVYQGTPCKSHFPRVQLVLDRRAEREAREERERTETLLSRGPRGFNLLKQ